MHILPQSEVLSVIMIFLIFSVFFLHLEITPAYYHYNYSKVTFLDRSSYGSEDVSRDAAGDAPFPRQQDTMIAACASPEAVWKHKVSFRRVYFTHLLLPVICLHWHVKRDIFTQTAPWEGKKRSTIKRRMKAIRKKKDYLKRMRPTGRKRKICTQRGVTRGAITLSQQQQKKNF